MVAWRTARVVAYLFVGQPARFGQLFGPRVSRVSHGTVARVDSNRPTGSVARQRNRYDEHVEFVKKPQDRKEYKKEDYQGILNVIKVLVVDDSEIDLMILTKILLKELYFSIDLATGVQQALTRVKVNKPDVILLDLVLQEEEGFLLIEKLKNNKNTQNIPIIAITARALQEDEKKSEELGVSEFITKPYDKHELITKITRLARKN